MEGDAPVDPSQGVGPGLVLKVPDDLVSKALYQAIDPDAVGDWDQLT